MNIYASFDVGGAYNMNEDIVLKWVV
jgi:hypothetical protein